jgi:hypothetical protein
MRGRPTSYNMLPHYIAKLDAILAVQPVVYATELFPNNWRKAERRHMLKEIKDTENYYILEMKETKIFKDFAEYTKHKDDVEIAVIPQTRIDCVTIQRPSGVKISLWPSEVHYVIKELQAWQDKLANLNPDEESN